MFLANEIYVSGKFGKKYFLKYKEYILLYFDDSHSDWCEVISHCGFD